jgi:hypothetical protein
MNSDEKQCPYCAELVKSNAIICKYCKSDLSRTDIKEVSQGEVINKTHVHIQSEYSLMSHGYIVFVILFPIIFSLLEVEFSLASDYVDFEKNFNSNKWIWIPILVNGILCDLDQRSLKKFGIKLKYGTLWSLVLVPVYLYMRGTQLNATYRIGYLKSQIFFFLWLISLAVSYPITEYLINYYY